MSKFELLIPRFVKTESYEVINLDNVSLHLKISEEVKSKYAGTTHFVRWSIVNGFPRISFSYAKSNAEIKDNPIQTGGKIGFNYHVIISFLNRILKSIEKGADGEEIINISNTEVIKKEVDGKVEITRGTEPIPEGILKFVIKDGNASLKFKDLKEKDETKAYMISIPLMLDAKFVKTNITSLEFAYGYFENVKNTLMVAQVKYLERREHVSSK